MKRRSTTSIVLATLLLFSASARPVLAQKDPSILTVDRIFASDDFDAGSFGPARWLDDSSYTTLEPAAAPGS